MPKRSHGFTLIEVLVAVMIIAVVIGALMQLFANNTHTFTSIDQKILQTNKTSLLLGNAVYGYENKKTDLAELVKDFNIDDDLRRLLKKEKVEVIYTETTTIDFGEAAEAVAEADNINDNTIVTETTAAASALEIGRTTLKIGAESSSFLRVKLQ